MTPAKRQTVSALLAAGAALGLPVANAAAALAHADATPKKATTTTKKKATTTAKKPATTTAAAARKSFTGDTYTMDRWGPVTVTITVQGGKVVEAKADMPMEKPRSEYINSRVGPYWNAQVVQLQSAGIELIGGATMSYDAYRQSLQSALDKAGIKAAA